MSIRFCSMPMAELRKVEILFDFVCRAYDGEWDSAKHLHQHLLVLDLTIRIV